MSERMIALGKSGDFFGPLYPYIIDDDVTDVDYNGREVWITDSDNCRHVCKDLILSQDFVDQFTGRVANGVSKAFNRQNPVLEAETASLRITIVRMIMGHEHLSTTQKYTHLSNPYIEDSLSRYWNQSTLIGGDSDGK